MYPKKDREEQAQIEVVFGLLGGELEDAPLRYMEERRWQATGEGTGEWQRGWAQYWYTGSPDYAPEIQRRWNGDVITIVWDRLYCGFAPRKIFAKGKWWRKVADYRSSGEAECLDHNTPNEEDKPCPICEAVRDQIHGYAYIGDGWFETVYVAR